MELEKKLDALKKIEKVDIPPFLFAKIMYRLKEDQKPQLIKSLSWTFAAAASLLLILNISVWIKINHQKAETNINILANGLELDNNNTFYHDQN